MQLPSWYTSPTVQVILVGITCFATVGMFSALTNLGAGGLQNVALSDTANGVHYGFFALSGFVGGGICNILGPPLTLFIGTLGYALYDGALWCYQTQGTSWFVIFAGILLGICAALLWSAQGEIMMSYPLEKDKGKAFAIFWAIFQFGSFIGSIIALAINIRSGKLSAVSTSTYIAFLAIIFVGIASAFLVLGPNHIIRADGSLVKLQSRTTIRQEVRGLLGLFTDWRMLALIPMFFASNYFYAYQGAVNAARFDAPTRALNATLEGAGAIIGAIMIGYFVLDSRHFSRRTRGYIGLGAVTVLTIIVWSCALAWQLTFDRADAKASKLINYKDKAYRGKGALYFFYYFSDACYQALAYWIMSALTNDPFTLARFAGFYKAIQSAGAAGSFGMDAVATPFLNEHLASWCLQLASFPLAFIVIRSIKETNYIDENMVFVDDLKTEDVEKKHEEADSKEMASMEDVA
ncbi:MFS general substrate transporter [Ramaria rubella]|nr:MFS general substrate transporter [Ramaria rubella]